MRADGATIRKTDDVSPDRSECKTGFVRRSIRQSNTLYVGPCVNNIDSIDRL